MHHARTPKLTFCLPVQNIGTFYAHDKYTCDSNHPQRQYRASSIAETVNKALQAVYDLANEPDEPQSQAEIVVAARDTIHTAVAANRQVDDDSHDAIDADYGSEPDDSDDGDYLPQ